LANPQKENGFTPVANEIVDALMQANLSGQESQVLWAIFRKTYGFSKKTDWISLSQFAKMTGMDRRNVHRALKKLSSKQMTVIQTDDRGRIRYGFQKNYEKWKLSSKQMTPPQTVIQTDDGLSSKQTPTKETIQKKENKRVPFGEIVDLYHEILPHLPGVKKLTPARKTQLTARWFESEKTCSLEWWKGYFEYVAQCSFLVGDNNRGWKADLEWITKEANFTKIIEGKYHKG
jgi:phage replication O-like protein O